MSFISNEAKKVFEEMGTQLNAEADRFKEDLKDLNTLLRNSGYSETVRDLESFMIEKHPNFKKAFYLAVADRKIQVVVAINKLRENLMYSWETDWDSISPLEDQPKAIRIAAKKRLKPFINQISSIAKEWYEKTYNIPLLPEITSAQIQILSNILIHQDVDPSKAGDINQKDIDFLRENGYIWGDPAYHLTEKGKIAFLDEDEVFMKFLTIEQIQSLLETGRLENNFTNWDKEKLEILCSEGYLHYDHTKIVRDKGRIALGRRGYDLLSKLEYEVLLEVERSGNPPPQKYSQVVQGLVDKGYIRRPINSLDVSGCLAPNDFLLTDKGIRALHPEK